MGALEALTATPFKAPSAPTSPALSGLTSKPYTPPPASNTPQQPTPKPSALAALTSKPYTVAPAAKPDEPAVTSTIPEKLGGGAYNRVPNNNNKVVNTGHTNYSGMPAKPGYQRNDIVPVSLGGENSNPKNMEYEPQNEADYRDGVEKYYAAQVKAGNIPLNAARVKVLDWKNTGIPGQKPYNAKAGGDQNLATNTIKSIPEGVNATARGVNTVLNEAGSGAKEGWDASQKQNQPKSFSNLGEKGLDAGVKTLSDTLQDSWSRIKNVVAAAKDEHTTKLQMGASEEEAAMGVANAIFLPITTSMAALEGVPGVGDMVDKVNGLFAAIGSGASKVASGAVDDMPISDDAKETIRQPVMEASALLGQLAVGDVGSEVIPKIAEKSQAIVQALKDHADSIPNKQGGFVKLPIPKELQPLAEEAKKYATPEEFYQKAITDKGMGSKPFEKFNLKWTKEGALTSDAFKEFTGNNSFHTFFNKVKEQSTETPKPSSFENHLESAKQVIAEKPDVSIPDLIKNTVTNIADGLKAEGDMAGSAAVKNIKPESYKDFGAFEKDVRARMATAHEAHITNPIDHNATPEQKVHQLTEMSKENQQTLDIVLQKIDGRLGTKSESDLKKPEKVLSKSQRPEILAQKPWHDVEHIRDALRSKTRINHISDVQHAVDEFRKAGIDIVKKDTGKMFAPKEWGWRFSALDLRMPNGQITEHYMAPKEMLEANKNEGHGLFDKWRNQTPEYKEEHKAAYTKDRFASRKQYKIAWEKYLRRTGQTDKEARASWSKVEASLSEKPELDSSAMSSKETSARGRQTPSTRSAQNPSDLASTQMRPSSDRPTIASSDDLSVPISLSIADKEQKVNGENSDPNESEIGAQAQQPGKQTINWRIPMPDTSRVPGELHEPHETYSEEVTDNNGGVKPPINKGGLQAPEIDWTKAKDIAAIRLSTDTMQRNIEKIFGKQADKVNDFLVKPVRENETARTKFLTKLRTDIKRDIVDKLGIHARSKESSLVQLLGEGLKTYDEVKAEVGPERAAKIKEATDYFRKTYDQLWQMWDQERAASGLGSIGKIENYFRHFDDTNASFLGNFIPTISTGKLPTAIAGITDYFKSRTPWSSAAMRRIGKETAIDAVTGLDNYLDAASRSIFHTDSVQRGRLLEKYVRETATALENPGEATRNLERKYKQTIENAQARVDDTFGSGTKAEYAKAQQELEHAKDALHDYMQGNPHQRLVLPNFAANLNDWTNLVSGKQARLDRAIESVVGRPALAFMRSVIRRFGANVIGGNISAAATHSIPLIYTLATVDTPSAFRGLMMTLPKPFMADFNRIGGQDSAFLTRRYFEKTIDPTRGEKVAAVISKPFQWVDEFISHFAVASKFSDGISKGMSAKDAMAEADDYASRVIGDRSVGNLPNLMNTKTLGMITQFQIEVNDNLRVLMHDVPRWAGGNPGKVAMTLAKFAVYSYLFNQVMQMIKGSGKGLDPINMGLTLAGLNDAGRGQDTMGRLQAFGTELAGELPFTSVITQGQYPTLQAIPIADAMKGDWGTALQKLASSFASPIGGGVQALKTYKGIEAWKAGVVLDSSGKTITPVPQTLPTLLQGVAFGPNAFAGVQKSNTELGNLAALIKVQQATSKAKNQQATAIWTDIKNIRDTQGADAAQQQLVSIATQDPDMAKRVLTAMGNDTAGITKSDTMLKTLGIANGQRAAYIKTQLAGMTSNDQKQQYLLDLADKKILTDEVLQQVLGQ